MDAAQLLEKQAADRAALYVKLVELPLYQPITRKTYDISAKHVRLHPVKHDMYCPECGDTSTFASFVSEEDMRLKNEDAMADQRASAAGRPRPYALGDWHQRFSLQLACARGGHNAFFYFVSAVKHHYIDETKTLRTEWTITKVGQHPSVTDFHRADVTRFKDGLSSAQQKDFVRAINTSAHGFNVAACVYYRRVFEGILEETAREMSAELPNQELPGYAEADTAGKIKLLAAELPKFLVENAHLYKLLSKGIHRLTEDDCRAEMPLIRDCIELIIEDRMVKINARKHREKTATLLAQANARYTAST